MRKEGVQRSFIRRADVESFSCRLPIHGFDGVDKPLSFSCSSELEFMFLIPSELSFLLRSVMHVPLLLRFVRIESHAHHSEPVFAVHLLNHVD